MKSSQKSLKKSHVSLYRKIKKKELSKTEENKIDPEEMYRIFGNPKLQWIKSKNVSGNEKQHRAMSQ